MGNSRIAANRISSESSFFVCIVAIPCIVVYSHDVTFDPSAASSRKLNVTRFVEGGGDHGISLDAELPARPWSELS